MLVSTTATVFALAAICAARPGAGVLRLRQDVIGPSAAFQIYAANPDQSFSLGGASDSSSSTTETSSMTDSSSSMESSSSSSSSSISSSSTISTSSTNASISTDADSSPTGKSLFSSLPSLTGGLPFPSIFSSRNASLASGGAASSTGFKIGYMRPREAKKIHDLDDILTNLREPKTQDLGDWLQSVEERKSSGLEDGVTSLEARQMGPVSTSMPSVTSASSTTSSLLSLPSMTSASSASSSLLSLPSITSASSIISSLLNPPNVTSASSSNSSTSSAASPSVTNQGGIAFEFRVSQDAGNTNDVDLVVSFANLPCGKSPGPFSFEFNFVPNTGYSSTGEGQINVFKVNGNLGNSPTYNSVDAATGSLIGTFELPTGSDANQPKLIFINQLVCEPTINLRFGISQYSSSAGAVAYFNQNGMGLRERSG